MWANPSERQEIEIKPPRIDENKCKYFALSTSFANDLLLIARVIRFSFFSSATLPQIRRPYKIPSNLNSKISPTPIFLPPTNNSSILGFIFMMITGEGGVGKSLTSIFQGINSNALPASRHFVFREIPAFRNLLLICTSSPRLDRCAREFKEFLRTRYVNRRVEVEDVFERRLNVDLHFE